MKKIDTLFRPLKLNPNDAKIIFHTVDLIVFNGMNNKKNNDGIKNLVLLDKEQKTGEQKLLQESIEAAIRKNNYEWLMLRVEENGNILEE